ncbi:ArsR family transcriptional regulator [Leucobacter luti]|nr:ArsR family transcriptional regulator [Leucobacter luti]
MTRALNPPTAALASAPEAATAAAGAGAGAGATTATAIAAAAVSSQPATTPGTTSAPMTFTPERTAELAHIFKALGDPARVKLFSLVSASPSGEMCICDLTAPVGLSQPTVSHHMRILVEAGLVTREQRGKWAYFSPTPEPLLCAVRDLTEAH